MTESEFCERLAQEIVRALKRKLGGFAPENHSRLEYHDTPAECSGLPPVDFTQKRLLTESDLRRTKKSQVLLISSSTRITPLAKDYIDSHNLVIRRQ